MESVWTAVKSTFQKRCAQFGKTLRRVSLKVLRNAIWRVDEWCHEQELKLRQEAERQELLAEVDPVASRARERSGRATRERIFEKLPACPRLRPASRPPQLRYKNGEFRIE